MSVIHDNPDAWTSADLTVQLSDDFNEEGEAPDHIDQTRWTKWQGAVTAGKGECTFAPIPADVFGLAGIGTRKKHFNVGLKATNGVEVALASYVQEGPPSEFTAETARLSGIAHDIEPLGPHFITGFALTIGDQHR